MRFIAIASLLIGLVFSSEAFLILLPRSSATLSYRLTPRLTLSSTPLEGGDAGIRSDFDTDSANSDQGVEGAVVIKIENMDDFEAAILETKQQSILAVMKAFVPWCRSCKAFDVKFRELYDELFAAGNPVKFYEVDVHAVKDVKNHLGIKMAPSLVMYKGGILIENFPAGPKKFPIVETKVREQLKKLKR